MAKQTLNNNVSFGEQRDKINSNFTEVYDNIGDLSNRINFTQKGTLPVSSVSKQKSFGDSITVGFLIDNPYNRYTSILGAKIGLDFGVVDNSRAESGSGIFTAISNSNRYLLDNGGSLITLMTGLNDLKAWDDTKTSSKIRTCLRSFIANAFMSNALNAGGNGNGDFGFFTKTGTWNNFDSTSIGGKAPFNTYTSGQSASSTVSGSSIQASIPQQTTGDLIIGTFTDDGQVSNYLGDFDVFVDDVLRLTYSPRGKNDGIRTNIAGDVQGRMPDVILLKGVAGTTVRIVTKSNTLTIIDYIGFLRPIQNCSPLMISLIPKCTEEGYDLLGGNASSINSDKADEVIKDSIAEWYGYPIAIVDVNAEYDPINTFDGVHPNKLGHRQIAEEFSSNVIGGLSIYENPNIDRVINGVNVGKGIGSPSKTVILGADIAGNGNDNVKIGNKAAGGMTTGFGSVVIGSWAGGSSILGNSDVIIGHRAAFGRDDNFRNNVGSQCIVIGAYTTLPMDGNGQLLIATVDGDETFVYGNGLGNYAIGSTLISSSALVALNSVNKGFLLPRLTTTQRDNISSPAEGLEIYNLTLHKKQFFNGTAWETITSS